MTEALETVISERNFLWQKANELYNSITQNGALTAATFKQACGLAGQLFEGKINMTISNSWFGAIANFLEMVETARAQKLGPKC